jgi:putative transposase
LFRVDAHALAKAQRKHQVALDTHQAVRAALTAQAQAAQPDRDAGERAAWRERVRRRRVVASIHERIRWRRRDFTHQESRKLVKQYDLLAVEDLLVRKMVRSMLWLRAFTTRPGHNSRASSPVRQHGPAGDWVVVDPKRTSQTCSGCGWRDPALTLADRVFHCLNPARPECRLVLDRDRNAARNILVRGTDLLTLGRQCLPSG